MMSDQRGLKPRLPRLSVKPHLRKFSLVNLGIRRPIAGGEEGTAEWRWHGRLGPDGGGPCYDE